MINGYRDLVKIKKCARCGYDENKGSLHVHHLDKNRYNNSRKNLIVLCANCHYALHHGKWKLEDIGLKTKPIQRNIIKKSSIKIEIKDIHNEINSIKASIENISGNITPIKVHEYNTVKNPKYIARKSELRLYIQDTRIFTLFEYDKICASINNASIRAIFDILISTGISYEEILQIYQFKELYNFSTNTITVLRNGEQYEIKVQNLFRYWLKFLWKIPQMPSEKSLDRMLQAFASKNDISPNGISILSLRKTIESWMLKAGIPEIEIYSRQGHDPVTSLRHYQSLSFTDYELRDIEKRLLEWGILRK